MNFSISRHKLYALGEPLGDSATRIEAGRRVYGGGGGGIPIVSDVVDVVGDAVGGAGDLVGSAVNTVTNIAGDALEPAVKVGEWSMENPLEAAALAAGAYYGLPALMGEGAGAAGAMGAAEGAGGLGGWDAAMADLAGSAGMGDVAGGLSALDAGMGAYPAVDVGAAATAPAVSGGLYDLATAPAATGALGGEGLVLPAAESAGVTALPSAAADYTLGPVSYDLTTAPIAASTLPETAGQGLTMASITGEAPNIAAMGGGQGLTADVGTALGDPGSFINNPAYIPESAVGDVVSASGVTDAAGLPALGNPSSFINNPSAILTSGGQQQQTQQQGLTGSGLLTAIGGLSGLIALLNADRSRYGVPGRQATTSPLSQFKYSPSTFMANTVDPNLFRPRFAEGGETSKKPKLTAKAKLAAMDPWTRAQAELGNAAYRAQMPVATATMPPPQPLGQLNMARGGISDLGGYSDGGRMLKGPGDGMSDSIPATIGGKREARLADNEFVVPADVVSHLGNGSSDAGAKQLYKMMDRVRTARTGHKRQGKQIDPEKYLPA